MIESFVEDLANWLHVLRDQENKKLFNNMQGNSSFYKYYDSYISELKNIKHCKNNESQISQIKKTLDGIKNNMKRKIPKNIQNKWIAINL